MLALIVLAAAPWVPLSNGVEWRNLDGLQVVRLSRSASLELGTADRRTAAEWLERKKAAAVVNAGMFQTDLRTSAGHLHCGKLVNQRTWNPTFQSVLVFRPTAPGLPAFTIVDLDQLGANETIAKYDCAVQNLRLIRAPGESVWRAPKRKWAESALALDREGRLLMIFSKTPVTMDAFIARLLKSDLEVVRAMHLDGGPEASLSLRGGTMQLDFFAGEQPTALPNVLLVY